MSSDKTLIVITGPTGSGKSALALSLARRLGCHIVSADSRQIYRGIPIGTAAPTADDMAAVPHHFVGTLGLEEYYSAAMFEEECLALLDRLFASSDYAILCGGSMMYVDAVTRGIDLMPTVSDENRRRAYDLYYSGGLAAVCRELQHLDPEYYAIVDRCNYKRIVHAIEICYQAGVPYSTLRTGRCKERPFRILKYALDLPRTTLFERINARTQAMVDQGLVEEACAVMHLRRLNSLNTVGYKEIFAYLDGEMTLGQAVEKIARNTRVYAKKQLTWLKKDPEIRLLDPAADPAERILSDLWL